MTSDRKASDTLWVGAKVALEEFNASYLEAQKMFRGHGPEDLTAAEKLLNDFAFRKLNTAPSFPGSPFFEWMSQAFLPGDIKNPDEFRPSGRMILEVIDGQREAEEFLTALDRYRDALEAVIHEVAPERFSYQGFKIWNPERLGDQLARRLLEGVDYVVALFKKRGVEPLLHKGVAQIEILPTSSMTRLNPTALGLYFNHSRTIVLSSKLVGHGIGRFMKWVNEAFLHEFGHFVHLDYLPTAAREAWDTSWNVVKERQEAIERAFKSISAEERARFFDALHFTKFDAAKASRRLDSIARVKFGVWLRNPIIGDPLITPKQFRWTRAGQRVVRFFTNPDQFMQNEYDWMTKGTEEYDRQAATVNKRMQDKLGLLWDGNMSIPSAAVQELAKSDPAMQRSVEDALDELEIVSSYGRTDEKEDFAETFVAFLGAPEKLTPTAKFRMQRTLSLAHFYNKPVMRLAEKDSLSRQVVSRYLHERRK